MLSAYLYVFRTMLRKRIESIQFALDNGRLEGEVAKESPFCVYDMAQITNVMGQTGILWYKSSML